MSVTDTWPPKRPGPASDRDPAGRCWGSVQGGFIKQLGDGAVGVASRDRHTAPTWLTQIIRALQDTTACLEGMHNSPLRAHTHYLSCAQFSESEKERERERDIRSLMIAP